jgi:acetyl-CoA C-acetyltransferase
MKRIIRSTQLSPRDVPEGEERKTVDTMLYDGLTCAFTGNSMGMTADNLARRFGISRKAQDRYALESHRRAVAAGDTAAFADEIIAVVGRSGPLDLVMHDEGPRRDTSLERMAKLTPTFRSDGTVTAGNSSMVSDGAAAVVVASESAVARLGVRPLARVVASTTSGGEPQDVFTAPVEAIRRAVAKAGRTIDDVDLFEINEAFAVQMLACLDQLSLSPERVNVHGGAIALGHPIGASGARALVTLLYAMQQRSARLGVAALCLGGGNAVAMLVERSL